MCRIPINILFSLLSSNKKDNLSIAFYHLFLRWNKFHTFYNNLYDNIMICLLLPLIPSTKKDNLTTAFSCLILLSSAAAAFIAGNYCFVPCRLYNCCFIPSRFYYNRSFLLMSNCIMMFCSNLNFFDSISTTT